MTQRRLLLILVPTVAVSVMLFCHRALAQPAHNPVVIRLAELEIDAAQLNAYTAALSEEIDASIGLEPGVLTLYAVSIKDRPAQIRLFEMYRDDAAYRSHLQTPHFLRYKAAVTAGMVKSLTLLETEPVRLGSKSLVK